MFYFSCFFPPFTKTFFNIRRLCWYPWIFASQGALRQSHFRLQGGSQPPTQGAGVPSVLLIATHVRLGLVQDTSTRMVHRLLSWL